MILAYGTFATTQRRSTLRPLLFRSPAPAHGLGAHTLSAHSSRSSIHHLIVVAARAHCMPSRPLSCGMDDACVGRPSPPRDAPPPNHMRCRHSHHESSIMLMPPPPLALLRARRVGVVRAHHDGLVAR